VLIQDHHRPYIGWQEYLENQQILSQNQTNKPEQLLPNIAREGRALLQGLVLCGGCGRRLSPRYKGNGGIYPVYECTARHQDTICLKTCICIQTNLLDEAVSRRVLEVLQPEQLQIALRAVNQLQERNEAIDRQWRMRIERLDYQAHLAQRRYEEVDPSHRLVATTLEQRWNQALEEAQRLKDDYQKYRQQEGFELTVKQQAQLLALAEDLPRLWQARTTSAKDRKRITQRQRQAIHQRHDQVDSLPLRNPSACIEATRRVYRQRVGCPLSDRYRRGPLLDPTGADPNS
jgi:uncharacterized protein YndB with AHSA1/START domain